MRDLLSGQVPEVLHAELYATPAILAAASFVAALHLYAVQPVGTVGCVVLVVAIRLWAVHYEVTAPRPRAAADEP